MTKKNILQGLKEKFGYSDKAINELFKTNKDYIEKGWTRKIFNQKRKQYLSKPLKAIEVKKRSVSGLLEIMGETGFQGKQLAKSVDVWEAMIKDPKNVIFLGYAGSLSTTGQWKIIRWLIENHYIDCLVSTGANISEDIFEAMGFSYWQGSHLADDQELCDCFIDRYYDVYADELDYRIMEEFIGSFLKSLDPCQCYSSAEFLYLFGKYQLSFGIKSITAIAAKEKIPIFSPGMADSGFGVAAYIARRKRNGKVVTVGQFRDFEQLGLIGEKAKQTSVIYIGGGVPKDTIQLVTVMSDLVKGGGTQAYPHKYAIQITTDSQQWGGLSGCTFEEAVSWGKIDSKATKAVCYCDATIALPIVAHALNERLKGKKRKGKNLNFIFNNLQ